jgi:hypothetical protein
MSEIQTYTAWFMDSDHGTGSPHPGQTFENGKPREVIRHHMQTPEGEYRVRSYQLVGTSSGPENYEYQFVSDELDPDSPLRRLHNA